jgi:hypothetical protein
VAKKYRLSAPMQNAMGFTTLISVELQYLALDMENLLSEMHTFSISATFRIVFQQQPEH